MLDLKIIETTSGTLAAAGSLLFTNESLLDIWFIFELS